MRLRSFAALAVAVALTFAAVAASVTARAESSEIDGVTLGALAERADAVVVATAVGPPTAGPSTTEQRTDPTAPGSVTWRLKVEESLRGSAPGAVVDVVVPEGRAPLAKGGRFLAFLRRTPTGWTTLELPWSVRTTAEDGVAALVDYARGYAALLDAEGHVADPAGLATFLVTALGSEASGVPACAGRDLLRHEEIHTLVITAQRALVTAALRTPRKPDEDFTGIVLAAGALGGEGTDELLVARLLDPVNRGQRRNVVEAMRRRATPALAALLAKAVAGAAGADGADAAQPGVPAAGAASGDGASAARRADLANALGRLDLREAETPLLALVADGDGAVRVEAAHGLGLLARAVRAPRPGADPDAPRPKLESAVAPLVLLAEKAATENERRASLWALAQVDVKAAWDALRRIAKEHADPRVRELAQRFLDQPRTALLLAP